MERLKHSVTLYGFGVDYIRGTQSLEDILRKTKKLDADGFEIVAPQMVSGHPNPDDAWVEHFIELYHKYDLTPVCYSIYVDSGKHKGRFLNETERITATINEMEYAKRMGFQVVRSQDALLPGTMEKLLPYVEELDLHLAIELHGPYSPTSPIFMEYAELFEKKNTDHLGVVMDFSAFQSGPPSTILDAFPDDVCHKDVLHRARKLFTFTDTPIEEIEEMILADGDDLDLLIARKKIFTGLEEGGKMGSAYYRTNPDFEGFRRLLKFSKYMHGKFYHVSEDLTCDEVNYPEFVKIMKEENYQGFIASEFEGGRYSPLYGEEDQLKLHMKMLDQLWASA